MAVQILTDSTSYIAEDLQKALNIKIVSLNIAFPDLSFKETDIDNASFYQLMQEKGIPKSSQPTVGELYHLMKEAVEKGDSLLCICLSAEMSGTYATAHSVKEMLLAEIPEAQIEIIDSRSNCMQLGFAVIQAARAAKEWSSLKEVKKAAEENIKRSRFLFIPDNLEYLKKGGRIGGASALLGNLLKIIPILTVENGKTAILKKIRTKKKAILAMIEKLLEDINAYGLGEVIVHHINCLPEALALANTIKEKLNIDIKVLDIGPVIGLHVGPGAIGIAYYTKENMR